MSRKKSRPWSLESPQPDQLSQMALEDGASQVVYGEVPYMQPLNYNKDSDLMFALPGEDSGALAEWDESSLPEHIEPQ